MHSHFFLKVPNSSASLGYVGIAILRFALLKGTPKKEQQVPLIQLEFLVDSPVSTLRIQYDGDSEWVPSTQQIKEEK